ncbi:MAG: methylenetetrahydrofolate reductase, partial [Alphaproteobacteria bacterium]
MMIPTAEAGRSILRETLRSGRFCITAELTPPVSTDPAVLLAAVRPLQGAVHAVNLTDGPGANPRMSSIAAAALLLRSGIEPVVQMACRDRNRLGLQGDAIGAAALGIRNVLVLRGDDPARGSQPGAKPVFDLDTRGLLATLAAIRDEGT